MKVPGGASVPKLNPSRDVIPHAVRVVEGRMRKSSTKMDHSNVMLNSLVAPLDMSATFTSSDPMPISISMFVSSCAAVTDGMVSTTIQPGSS